MAADGMTLAQAVVLLRAFLNSGTPPGRDVSQQRSILSLALDAIASRRAFADPDFPGSTQTLQQSAWYKKAIEKPRTDPPPSWSFKDTLATLTTLSFALPEGGAVASSLLGGLQTWISNSDAQAAYYEKLGAGGNAPDNPFTALSVQMAAFATTDDMRRDRDTLLGRVAQLDAAISRLLDKADDVSTVALGFSPRWLAGNPTRADALDDVSGLGQVWALLDDDPFNALFAPADASTPQLKLGLIDAPTLDMCTINVYCRVVATIVNALVLHAFVSLMPDEALKPGWDAAGFDMRTAVASPRWNELPGPNVKKTARDCWQILYQLLDPDGPGTNYLSRVHPVHGDAQQAYLLIRRRLDRITAESNLPAHRDGLWFLQEETTATYNISFDEIGDIDPVFKSFCRDGQSEVKDTGLSPADHDDFVSGYRNFNTTLRLTWEAQMPKVLGTIFTLAPFLAASTEVLPNVISAYQENDRHPWRQSPWREGNHDTVFEGSCNQVCWYADAPQSPDPKMLDRCQHRVMMDGLAWAAFVLSNYLKKMNYTIDTEHGIGLAQQAHVHYDAWVKVHKTAQAFLAAGPLPDDGHGLVG